MSATLGDKTYAKRQRQPFETPVGERAFKIAAREAVTGSGSRGKATPRRGKGGSLSGGRGSGSAAHVEDNGGTEGKTIPIELEDDMLIGEIDSTYLKYHKVLLKRHPPTKYDNSVYIEHTNYDGAGYLVKKAREENPYVNPKMAAIDYRFWSVFHFKFYETVLNTKMKLIKMKWIDFTHLEAAEESVKEDVLELVDKYRMRDIMSFKYDWNIEVLAQFHATFFHEDSLETIHWMIEAVHYKIDFTTFARLFGFSKDDREAEVIHFGAHMNHNKIASAYEYDELADGSTTALKSVYYVLNNMFRETIYPKGGSDSTSLRRFAPNLIARLLPGAQPFSVSKFIWFKIVEMTESGKCNLHYAPYIMYMIEMVSGISFKKDVDHASYQVKQWQHQKKQQVVEEHILKKASSE
jgi:hypothetical protein